MKWTFKLNGKQVTWEIADNVVAIPPSPDFKRPKMNSRKRQPNGKEQWLRTETLQPNGYKPKRSDLDREIYDAHGWQFVDPAQAGTADAAQVFFD
jgi:hypothetical protein